MRQILLLILMLLTVVALFTGQAIRDDRAASQRASDAPEAASLEPALFPEAPTSADMVEVRIGEGSEDPEQALRVAGSNEFFVEVIEVPAQATYTLGALAPGEYTFSLFQQIPGTLFCSHELLGELSFTVKPAPRMGSGLVFLVLKGVNRSEAEVLVEGENPQVSWLFGEVAVLQLIPGLEASYRQLLRGRPEVEAVELNSVGFIPECPPPLGPAVAPGSLLVSFQEGIERKQAEALLRQLPPQLEAFWQLPLLIWHPLAFTKVRVPQGWEHLFLRRYLELPEVLYGWVFAPRRARLSQVGEGEAR